MVAAIIIHSSPASPCMLSVHLVWGIPNGRLCGFGFFSVNRLVQWLVWSRYTKWPVQLHRNWHNLEMMSINSVFCLTHSLVFLSRRLAPTIRYSMALWATWSIAIIPIPGYTSFQIRCRFSFDIVISWPKYVKEWTRSMYLPLSITVWHNFSF